jgi:hypothetical protein
VRTSKRILALLGSLALLGLGGLAWKARAEGPVSARPGKGTPVVVELFSSEGCSSCPPADAFLRELDRTQPYVPGVSVVALEFHVDYWDYLGWRDPYSRHEFTARQEAYARALGERGIYTPEIVVQGNVALGSRDSSSSRQRLESEAVNASARVSVVNAGSSIRVHVESAVAPVASGDEREVWLAVTESGLRTEVLAGENRGRALDHAPIVRRLLRVGELRGPVFDGEARVEVEPTWKARNLRFVGFVQERHSRRILGAGTS